MDRGVCVRNQRGRHIGEEAADIDSEQQRPHISPGLIRSLDGGLEQARPLRGDRFGESGDRRTRLSGPLGTSGGKDSRLR